MSEIDALTAGLTTALKDAGSDIVSLIMARKQGIGVYTDNIIKQYMTPIFDDLFKDGRQASVKVIKEELVDLVGKYDVNMKYNKTVLDSINQKSIFKGYFEKEYQGLFTRREILDMKKVILQGKYAGLTEQQVSSNLLDVVNTTKKRAQLLARTETSRLRAAAQEEYYKIPAVKKEYEKVHETLDSNTRSSHKEYDGQVADEDGLFHGGLGSFSFAPIPGEFNCQCRTVLRKRTEEK